MASTSTSLSSIPNLDYYNDSVYKFHIPQGDPKAEIIFFHDIHWQEYKEPHVQSWMSRSDPSVCWPKDWLSAQYPNARILSTRYDAGMWKKDIEGQMDLHLLAENLYQDIIAVYEEDCPIFLVGHGLGGLVIKKLLESVKQKLDRMVWHKSDENTLKIRRFESFLKNVEGAFFYSPPFLGSKLGDTLTSFPYREGSSLLQTLKTHGKETCRLNEWFRDWRRGSHCRTTAIFAAHKTNVALWYGHWSTHVVDEASARNDIDDFYTIARDHFSVCRPLDQRDSGFQRLTELINSGMPKVAHMHIDEMKDSEKHVSIELLHKLLTGIAKLENKAARLKRVEVQKICKFPGMRHCLEDGLKRAGLFKTGEDDFFEYWEPIYEYNESGAMWSHSPSRARS